MIRSTYLSNLNAIRGIAAVLTAVYHVNPLLSFLGGTLIPEGSTQILNQLYLMVDMFFVLSGFIMCYVYAHYFEIAVTKQKFKQFIAARFARIYPLHLFSLLLTASLLLLLYKWGAEVPPLVDAENSWWSFTTNLFLLHSMNLHNWFTFTHASWSISTEWWAYMLFPFLVKPFLKTSVSTRVVIFSICAAGYFLIGNLLAPLVQVPPSLNFLKRSPDAPFSLDLTYQFGFFRCLFGFVIGMMIYLGFKSGFAKKLLSTGFAFLILSLGLLAALHWGLHDILIVLFFPFIILSAAYGNRSVNAVLNAKPFQLLGDFSFSIYLIHQPILYQAGIVLMNPAKTGFVVPKTGIAASWAVCVSAIIIFIAAAAFTYHFVEKPARKFLNRKIADRADPAKMSERIR